MSRSEPLAIAATARGLALAGELDARTAPALGRELLAFAGRDIDIDMAMVTFIDSSGLGVLLRARAGGVDVRLLRVPDNIRRLLDIIGSLDLIADE